MTPAGFVPPPYPYDRLVPVREVAARHDGGAIDLSIGTPCDDPPPAVVEALCTSGSERGYPPSIGTQAFRAAAAGWLDRRLGVTVDPGSELAACVGTKELVAGVPAWLGLRSPGRDTVLYPEISYPTYAMGATLAGMRAVPIPLDGAWRMDLGSIDPADASRAVCLWANVPGNPTGALDDLDRIAEWGRTHDVPVLSDECYVEFTWAGPPRTILSSGTRGVLAVHSLSKRSNLAGARAGFYAGDAELVGYLSEVRKHVGLMVPGPVQAAAAAALGDDAHVDAQRERYQRRLGALVDVLGAVGVPSSMPEGAFYLWVPAPDGDAWGLVRHLASTLGVVVSPGEFYGPSGSGHVRVAAVATDDRIAELTSRVP